MNGAFLLVSHLISALAKLIRPGGHRAVIAENLLLKQQLIIHSRPDSGDRIPICRGGTSGSVLEIGILSPDFRWWLNFRGEAVKVEMEIARQRYPGTAVLLEGDSEALREGVRRFIRALPRDAKVYGLKLAADGEVVEASLATIAGQLILVEIRLDD